MKSERASWQKRRWALFLKANENTEFRSAFLSIISQDKTPELVADMVMLLAEYDVPSNCLYAAIKYAENPALHEATYLSLIQAPLNFWSMATDKNGPNDTRNVLQRFRERLNQAGKSELINDDNLAELITTLFTNHTVIELSSFLTKQEVSEMMTQYWPELEPMINDTSMEQDWVYSQGLKDKVYQPKAPNRLKVEEAIVQLPQQGYNDTQIATFLEENELGSYDTGHIRVIRSRLKKK